MLDKDAKYLLVQPGIEFIPVEGSHDEATQQKTSDNMIKWASRLLPPENLVIIPTRTTNLKDRMVHMQQNYSIDIAALLETWYAVKARLSVQELDAVEGMRGAIFSWVSFKGVQEPLIDCPRPLADVISHLEKFTTQCLTSRFRFSKSAQSNRRK